MPDRPKHANMVDGHAAELAPKGLMPGHPADQSYPATLSSIVFLHANLRLEGVWPGRPADQTGPVQLILLLQFNSEYKSPPTFAAAPDSSIYYTFPPDCSDKMSEE